MRVEAHPDTMALERTCMEGIEVVPDPCDVGEGAGDIALVS